MTQHSDQAEAVVFVVEDDDSQREAITALLRMNGFKVECFASGQDFQQMPLPDALAASSLT